jgi:asparagine synthase (glutamine-hydrolysing)
VSGLCGFVGAADRAVIDRMLGAIAYRGDATDTAQGEGVALGYRFWRGRPGKSPGIHRAGSDLSVCAGTLAPPVPSPAAALPDLLRPGGAGLARADGAFAGAVWDAATRRLTLVRDPFGVRSLYYTEHGGVFYFASELKQLLAVPDLPVALSGAAVHNYLTFSFVPGEEVPIEGIRRLLPGHTATFERGRLETAAYFTLQEKLDPALAEAPAAVRRLRQVASEAVARRLNGEPRVGLYLSGGLDSSAVGVWPKQAGVAVEALSLDFGEQSVEREQAAEVARRLEMPLTFVRADPEEVGRLLMDLVWKLDLPFGDAVTGPQYLLGRAAQQAGLSAVFNGEGGDQLFGGWTSKPMVAAAVYGDLYQDETPEEVYLRSYHRFYGLEDELYTPALRAAVGGPGQRRAMLRPYLGDEGTGSFLHRVRLADISLKGSQSILPRAERLANAFALDLRVPLYDRALAELSFSLPPELKLHGACEKYVLKLALKGLLPESIVWRRKYGMSVPATDWLLGPLARVADGLLGARSLAARGLFQSAYVERLRRGEDSPGETRRRRVGERLWALLMLEAWLRVFIDVRGRRPEPLS